MHFTRIAYLFSTLALASLLSLSPQAADYAQAAGKAELTVAAAASLTNAFTTLKQKFEAQNPGVTVNTSFAASNTLLRQLQTGAPVDVFASADQATMDKAAADNLLLPDSRADFAANGLVLIAPKGVKTPPANAQALRQPGVKKIAVGNPDSVPAGRYTRESLQKDGLWDALAPKYVLGQSVRQVLDYVSRGEVDAGFVYTTDAIIAKDKVMIMATMQNHTPVLYPIAVLKGSKNPTLAKKFTDFVRSAEGQAVLKEYGFSTPTHAGKK